MRLPGDTQTMSLPFEASFCGEIPVSAWRSGKYDGDPMNIAYDRNEGEREKAWQGAVPLGSSKVACVDNAKPQAELPQPGSQCAEKEFAKRGRPSMYPPHNGVATGFSTPQESTTVYMWMDNQTNESRSYSTCSTTGVVDAIDVYDSAWHRLLSKQEQRLRKTCAEHQEFLPMGCSWSKTVTVAPHTIQVVDSSDLSGSYLLSPGRFFIVASQVQRQTCESVNKTLAEETKVRPANALLMAIPEE